MHTAWGLPEKGRRFYALVMVEKTNLSICHGVMGTTQAENDQQCNQVDAIDSSRHRASSCITGFKSQPTFAVPAGIVAGV